MKILNLYSCLGGNRYKWGNEDEITAVENDVFLADLYKERFPNDNVIIGDAHEYLLNHFQEFDFIWSSPPCPTHSKSRFARRETTTPKFPDLTLYQEIIFLKHHFKGKFCVENVIPYYQPLIPAQKRGRHLFWCNFILPQKLSYRHSNFMEQKNEIENWSKFHEFDFKKYQGNQRTDKIARNLVDYEAGKTILETAKGIIKKANQNQIELF